MDATFQKGQFPKPQAPEGYTPNYDEIPTNPSGRFTLRKTRTGISFEGVSKTTLDHAIGQIIGYAFRNDCNISHEDLVSINTKVLGNQTKVSEYDEPLLEDVSAKYSIEELIKLGTDGISRKVLQEFGVLLNNTPIEIEVIREEFLNDF